MRKRGWIAVLAVVGLAITTVAVRRSLGPRVAVQRVHRAEIVQRVVVSGRVLPPARINLASVVTGRVALVAASEGQQVVGGQTLLVLDAAEAKAALAQAEAGLAQARARLHHTRTVGVALAREAHNEGEAMLEAAHLQFERAQALLHAGSGTQAEFDDKRRALDVARAKHDAADAQAQSLGPSGANHRLAVADYDQAAADVAAAQVRLDQTTIVAPSDAVVLTRGVEPGDVVAPGKVLLLLARRGKTLLMVEPDEKNLAFLAIGQKARASADAFASQTFEAVVNYIAPSVDPQRGTVEVRLNVSTPPNYLRPDMTVSVDIEVGRKTGVIVVPATALISTDNDHGRVQTLHAGRIVTRDVSLGLRDNDNVEVTRGLRGGESLLLHPSPELRDGKPARAIGGG